MGGGTLTIREWFADYRSCRLSRGGESRSIEPKVMELLALLATKPGEVFSRDEILASLWPRTTVGDDTVARYIFKLRRALDDDPQAPRFIETIPRRGYRLIASEPETEALKRRADEFYFQATRADNEAAIALYERAIALDAGDTAALAGLANGLVQRALRWLGDPPRTTLGQALDCGVFATPEGKALLSRARSLSERALEIAPNDAMALKALGLVMSASHRFAEAKTLYERAIAADPKAWSVLINLADLHGLEGRASEAIRYLERAHSVMSAVYEKEIAMVRPWYAALGVLIGDRHRALGHDAEAQMWYRKVLAYFPVHEAATVGLASVLAANGEADAARRLCLDLIGRIGHSEACTRFIEETRSV